jgi:RimJ/RimL family protein N-acetyltransferase
MKANNVVLRNVMEGDLPIFYEYQLDIDATRMADFPSRDKDVFMVHWKKIMGNQNNILQTIIFNEQVAGNIVSWEQDNEQEVGYWLGKEYWGRGIATVALTGLLELIKTRPLYAHVVKHNVASLRVLGKCGFMVCRENGEEVVLELTSEH